MLLDHSMSSMQVLVAAALLVWPIASGLAQDPPPPPAVPVEPVEETPLDASAPEQIQGAGIVLDGRTLLVGETRIRLFGVEQGDESTIAQLEARAALEDLVAGGDVACDIVDRDRDGTLRATCEAAGIELGEALIASGAGVPSRLDTHSGAAPPDLGARYDAVEVQARAAGLGLWEALRPQPEPPSDERPRWIPDWLWRIPTGLGALIGSLLGFLGLTVTAIVLARARR